MIRTFYIRTFGCQMNEHDSDRMSQLLMTAGLQPVSTPKEADLIIINSCSVREKPEHKALSEAGKYKKSRHAKGKRIILAGCVAQQEGKRLLQQAPYLDAVLGPDAINHLPDIVAEMERGKCAVLDVDLHQQADPRFVPLCPVGDIRTSMPVTIMKGCNNFCTYCVVPHVRGREVSRSRREILDEVEALSKRGCREVVLLGQNVNSYCDSDGTTFTMLLKALNQQAAVMRIRFTTSHPKDLGPDLIEAMASLERVCQHIHLALQSGSDRILQKMNRGYSGAQFVEKAQTLRQRVLGISITTDLIVGFPTEIERDFQDTVDVVERVAFDLAYSFKYSPRPQTAALQWPDDVPPELKAQRLLALQTVLNRVESTRLRLLVGSTCEVLVEGKSLRDPGHWTGRTSCNRVVNFLGTQDMSLGQMAKVSILEARGHTLWGTEAK